MEEGIATFCRQEARAALVGSIIGRQTRWMSHPAAIWEAEYKPFQLDLAAASGFKIPPTIITNSPTRIREAFREFGSMIVKSTKAGHLIRNGVDHAIYTSRVLEEHIDQLESARWSPAIYQALIPKLFDVRVTIVGSQCFAAAIDSQSDPAAMVDWRQTENPQLPHERLRLPDRLTCQLQQLMRSLRLTFAAIDLIQTPSGDYVFLEVNPSGQWLWLDDRLTLGISDEVASWLSVCGNHD
jgi:glutathione synthase/RimK-type ligase-like ATP-grasp enzyme